MEDVNIYEDLDTIDAGISFEKFEQENAVLTKRVNEQQQLIQQMTSDISSLQISNKNLQLNISELFKTAKAEIARKERDVADLRRQVDEMIFHRQTKNPMQTNNFPDKDDMMKQIYNLRDEMDKKNRIISSLNKKLEEHKEPKNESFLKRRLEADPNDLKYKKMKYNRNYNKNSFNQNYNRKYRSPSRSPDRPYRKEKSPDRYRNVDTRFKPKLILSKSELMKIYGTDTSDQDKLRIRPKSPINDHPENKYNRPKSPLYEDKNCSRPEESKKLNNENFNSDIKKPRIGPRTPSYNGENSENENVILQPTITEKEIKTLGKETRIPCNEEYVEHEMLPLQTDSVTNVPKSPISLTKPENEPPTNFKDSAKVLNKLLNTSQTAINPKEIHRKTHEPARSRTKNYKGESEKLQQISKNENDSDSLRNTPKSPKHDKPLLAVKSVECTDSPPHDPRTYQNREREDTDLTKLNRDNYQQQQRLTSKEYFTQEQNQEYLTKAYKDTLEEGEILSPQYEEEDCRQEELALMEARKKLNDEILSLEENIRNTKKRLHKKSKLRTLKADIWSDLNLDTSKKIDTQIDPILKPDKKNKKDKKSIDSIATTKESEDIPSKTNPSKNDNEKKINNESDDTKNTRKSKSRSNRKSSIEGKSSIKLIESKVNIEIPHSKLDETETKTLDNNHKTDETITKGIELTASNVSTKMKNAESSIQSTIVEEKISETNRISESFSKAKDMNNLIDAIKMTGHAKSFSKGKDMNNLIDTINDTKRNDSILEDSKLDEPPEDTKGTTVKEVQKEIETSKQPKKDKKSNKSSATTKESEDKTHKPSKTNPSRNDNDNKMNKESDDTKNTRKSKSKSNKKSTIDGKNDIQKSDTSEKDMRKLIETKVDIEITHSKLEATETKTHENNHKTDETSTKGIELTASNVSTNMKNAESSTQSTLVEERISETQMISKSFSKDKDMINLIDAIKVTGHARSFSRGKDMNNLIDAIKDSTLNHSILDDSILDDSILDDSKLDESPEDTKDVRKEIETSKKILKFNLPPKMDLDTEIIETKDNTEDKISAFVNNSDNLQIQAILTKLKDDIINNDTKIDLDNLKINAINKDSNIEKTESMKSAECSGVKNIELVKENTSELKLKRKRLVKTKQSPRKCKVTKPIEKDKIGSSKDELSLLQEEMSKIFEEPIDANIVKEPIIEEEKKPKTKEIKLAVRRSPRKSKADAKLLQETAILKQDIRNVVTVEDILGDSMLSEPVQERVASSDKLDNTTTEVNVINTALTDQPTDTKILPPAQTGENKGSRKKLTGRRRRAVITII